MRKLKRKVRGKAEPGKAIKPSSVIPEIPTGAGPGFGSRYQELLRLERKQFPKAGEERRVRRALRALDKLRGSINLDLETLKRIAQDPDLGEF